MTLKELISKKDYDYIEFRCLTPPDYAEETGKTEMFYGSGYSKDGIFYPNDQDSYSLEEELERWEEWTDYWAENGLTVVEKGAWITTII